MKQPDLIPIAGDATSDACWMQRAIAAGALGDARVRPNPLVGCVLVQDGVQVGLGWHAQVGGPHAEIVALADAGDCARGATAYVTLEPCNHHGRTGPCTEALIAAGVARVVIGCRDPHHAAAGGLARLAEAGVAVTAGVEELAAGALAEVFLTNVVQRRPFVQLKLAATLDGRTAARDGTSRWVTGEGARAAVAQLRAQADAVLIGSGTALADDPRLDLRHLSHDLRSQADGAAGPVRVVLDRRGRFHSGLQLAQPGTQRTVVYAVPGAWSGKAEALTQAGVALCEIPDGGDWLQRVLADLLAHHRICHVLCEGGPTVAAALLQACAVDRIDLLLAPKLLGAGAPVIEDLGIGTIAAAQVWQWSSVQMVGSDVWLVARPGAQPHPVG